MASLFAREGSTMAQIQDKTLARLLNELGMDCDLRDFAERCEILMEPALTTGSALVACAALHRQPPGFDRVALGSIFLAKLDFRVAGRDAYYLVSDFARNLAMADSSSLSRPYKIDRALFISSRLEQVSQEVINPKERLAAAVCADALRFCCTKSDLGLSALECSGLKGPEVEWARIHAVSVEFRNLFLFVDEVRSLLWPNCLSCVTQLTYVASEQQTTRMGEDGETFVAL